MQKEKKQISKKGFKIKWSVIIGLLMVVVIAVNAVLFVPLQTVLTNYFTPKIERTLATKDAASKLTEEIAAEGVVLLKNENKTLPLTEDKKKVNVFGWSSTNPVYGGTGSGSTDTSTAVDFLKGLNNAGIETNTEITDFYKAYAKARPAISMGGQDWTIPEPTMKEYTDKGIFENAKEFSDTAIVMIARSGGEGADLPRSITDEDTLKPGGMFGDEGVRYTSNADDVNPDKHYLELSNREEAMLEKVTSEFKNVIIVLNMSNAMELSWVDEYQNVNAVVWVGGPGESGFNSVGKVLSGEVNPSGRTVDTYVKDLTKTNTYNNFGNFEYTDSDGYHFLNYTEGIYLGYRFYETYYMNNEAGYEKAIQYPFGYGLSYTSFKQKMGEVTKGDNNTLTVDVTVTNTGDVAGKEVVQLYNTAPYTEGGIEKANVVLAAFDKTQLLNPGESETITLTLNEEDLASYDYQKEKAYVLEKGSYELKLMQNSHEVIDSSTYDVAKTIVYAGESGRKADAVTAENQFAFAEGDLTYLSRANNFENYEQATKAAENRVMTDAEKEAAVYTAVEDETAEVPAMGQKNGLKLVDMAGKAYEDPDWDKLLDQLSDADMNSLISYGGYQTKAVKSIGKDRVVDIDGPAGLSTFMGASLKGCAYPTEVVIASTYNVDLAEKRGTMVGNEALELGVSGWYGPAMNIHRSEFSGRNFEYYSEDGLLAGKMGAKETSGAASRGLYAYIKHFALNDQETNRCDKLATWSNEQAIREIYLKPFELSVKEGGATAVMSSFNFIGLQWAGGCSELLQNVLRDEWGFKGVVITDYFGGYGYMDADQAIAEGNDLMLSTLGSDGATLDASTSPTGKTHMRTASHNILYTIANSNAVYTNEKKNELLASVGGEVKESGIITKMAGSMDLQPWMLVAIAIDIVIAALVIVLVIFKVKKYKTISEISVQEE